MNAVTYQHDYADAAFNKLFEFLAIETSYSNNHENKGLLIKYRGCLISITLVALILVIVSPLYLFDSKDNSRFSNENILSEQCIRIEDSIIPRIPIETSNSNHSVNSTIAKTETKKETNMKDSTNMLAYTLPELNVEGKVRESYVPQQVNDASDGYSNLIIRKQIPANIPLRKHKLLIHKHLCCICNTFNPTFAPQICPI